MALITGIATVYIGWNVWHLRSNNDKKGFRYKKVIFISLTAICCCKISTRNSAVRLVGLILQLFSTTPNSHSVLKVIQQILIDLPTLLIISTFSVLASYLADLN